MSAKKKKIAELLLPGESQWELWSLPEGGAAALQQTFPDVPGSFGRTAQRRVLALPATSLWVLPAWLAGDAAHLRDMALLHLERMSVKVPEHEQGLQVDNLATEEGAHLTRIIALRDTATPLSSFAQLPTDCVASASCYTLPGNSLVLWRELGKLVVGITVGPRLAYFSAMSSAALDAHGLAELNNICLQLSFQRVLSHIEQIVLWTDEGDEGRIQQATGITVLRMEKPQPRIVGASKDSLMPQDVLSARVAAQSGAKQRSMLLTAGFALSVLMAGFALVIAQATKERAVYQAQVAHIMPKASKVGAHKAAWMEVGSAVDPDLLPMGVLLRCMEPSSSGQISVTHFECNKDTVILRGRAPDASPALKYIEELKNTESLAAYTWESGTPQVGAQGTEFEIKGTRS